MAGELIIACPTCAQKYRVSPARVGQYATCKKCAQRFRIQTDPPAEAPIDDDTILGWVMEESSPDQSVLGSTSIFVPTTKRTRRLQVHGWETPEPPAKPRVKLDRIDDIGAYFEFPANQLRYADIRRSFPYKCVQCLKSDNLEIRLIIWGDKLPRQDSFHRHELETKALGRLDQMLRQHQRRWFDNLEPLSILPPPFCNPFPYFVCTQCSSVGEITSHIMNREDGEYCQIAIANLDIACEFLFNNGGAGESAYRRLKDASQHQRDDRWRRLAFPVRTRISTWFRPGEGERFLGYFADSDFSRAETGNAGVVLTDRRMIFKKYSTTREYPIESGGKLHITADRKQAVIRILQPGRREAALHASPLAASHLAKSLAKLKTAWAVDVKTRAHPDSSNTKTA